MKVLLVGSGAREHAIAWKMTASPRLSALYCAPGNAGTAGIAANVDIPADDVEGLAEFVAGNDIDLVVAGPEAPLSLGLGDAVARLRGGKSPLCFGPSRAAARIESSKSFSKLFMKRHGIPTADFRVFASFGEAADFIAEAPWPYVIKAAGLASGKGVFLPASADEGEAVLAALLRDRKMGEAGAEVIVEERLEGEELSLLAFSDGTRISLMPPSQDHKRLLDGDRGPNTGGMGAIASGSALRSAEVEEMGRAFLQKAVDGMQEEGFEYRGVLYAGLILTKDGPKALEYNCRFGDPEAEAILPLLKTDIIDIFEACAGGDLGKAPAEWEDRYGACVVIASRGYATENPFSGSREVFDSNPAGGEGMVFHGATKVRNGKVMAAGGRLLCASSRGDSLEAAIAGAYSLVGRIDISESQHRHDIGTGRAFLRGGAGFGAARPSAEPGAAPSQAAAKEAGAGGMAPPAGKAPSRALGSAAVAYSGAGVDILAGDRAIELMSAAVKSTYGPEVLAGIGSFGGMYDAKSLKAMRNPVLVSSTDGVGTKVMLAAGEGRFAGVGRDIVNHCIDDILVQGATPLFFLDYFATSRLDPEITAKVVSGMAEACRAAGCALIGGETAEMPGVYLPGEFDIAGTIVGVAEKDGILPGDNLRAGDLIVGLESSGLHTNGFSLARKVFEGEDISARSPALGMSIADALLVSHRSYLDVIGPILRDRPGMIKALAHITGGGFEGNVPRVLPATVDAHIIRDSWPVPPIFRLIMERGKIGAEEMYRVFNMGIGMTVFIEESDKDEFMRLAGDGAHVIGYLGKGEGKAVVEGIK